MATLKQICRWEQLCVLMMVCLWTLFGSFRQNLNCIFLSCMKAECFVPELCTLDLWIATSSVQFISAVQYGSWIGEPLGSGWGWEEADGESAGKGNKRIYEGLRRERILFVVCERVWKGVCVFSLWLFYVPVLKLLCFPCALNVWGVVCQHQWCTQI